MLQFSHRDDDEKAAPTFPEAKMECGVDGASSGKRRDLSENSPSHSWKTCLDFDSIRRPEIRCSVTLWESPALNYLQVREMSLPSRGLFEAPVEWKKRVRLHIRCAGEHPGHQIRRSRKGNLPDAYRKPFETAGAI